MPGAPTISTVTPGKAPENTTPVLVVTGTNLGTASAASINSQPCTGIVVVNDTTLNLTGPSLPRGHYDLTVTTDEATALWDQQFIYHPVHASGD